MTRNIEEPVTVEDHGPARETVTTHPAFCQIRASRVSGHASLYDSDFQHQHYMTIEIKRSELMRGLNRDWHFAREQLIEVALTESQWATFVSSLNMGGGVPCTLERFDGKSVPRLPEPKSRTDQFAAEMQSKMERIVKRIDTAMEGAKTKAQREELAMIRQDIVSNLPFIAKQFEEHMETTTEKAKQEIHGYMNGVVQRAGIAALGGDAPLLIEGDSQ